LVCANVNIILLSCIEYKDDSTIIPRSSSVIVSRLPPARAGKGRAAMYVAGVDAKGAVASGTGSATVPSAPYKGPSGPMSRRFDGKDEPGAASKPSSSATSEVCLITLPARRRCLCKCNRNHPLHPFSPMKQRALPRCLLSLSSNGRKRRRKCNSRLC
jgi:hypothetical protein